MAWTLGIDVAVRAEHQATLARDVPRYGGAGSSGHGRPIGNGCGRTWTCPIRLS
ncbi:hypothetical protein SAMN04490220_8366 [Rhodococcus jostii]|uniref:Uncharacterized protein n=1 Tax=Rhodococcus jostii TaxID=132919 RepID=A0A1H5JTS3_RHOJO|nr:hypothetical protein SAMN04490220_8366 [Rhodococcus jostii]